jgi:hypothetical protein
MFPINGPLLFGGLAYFGFIFYQVYVTLKALGSAPVDDEGAKDGGTA